jgi:hypothetical protein
MSFVLLVVQDCFPNYKAMTDGRGVIMYSPEEQFHITKLRESQKKKNVVFPTTETPETKIQPGSFVYDLRPMFQLQKLLGHFPLHTYDSGNIGNENNNEKSVRTICTMKSK